MRYDISDVRVTTVQSTGHRYEPFTGRGVVSNQSVREFSYSRGAGINKSGGVLVMVGQKRLNDE